MKILYVGCPVRIVDELSLIDMIIAGPVCGREGIIVARNESDRLTWTVHVLGIPLIHAHQDALEPVLPEGLLEQIREEALDLEPELAT